MNKSKSIIIFFLCTTLILEPLLALSPTSTLSPTAAIIMQRANASLEEASSALDRTIEFWSIYHTLATQVSASNVQTCIITLESLSSLLSDDTHLFLLHQTECSHLITQLLDSHHAKKDGLAYGRNYSIKMNETFVNLIERLLQHPHLSLSAQQAYGLFTVFSNLIIDSEMDVRRTGLKGLQILLNNPNSQQHLTLTQLKAVYHVLIVTVHEKQNVNLHEEIVSVFHVLLNISKNGQEILTPDTFQQRFTEQMQALSTRGITRARLYLLHVMLTSSLANHFTQDQITQYFTQVLEFIKVDTLYYPELAKILVAMSHLNNFSSYNTYPLLSKLIEHLINAIEQVVNSEASTEAKFCFPAKALEALIQAGLPIQFTQEHIITLFTLLKRAHNDYVVRDIAKVFSVLLSTQHPQLKKEYMQTVINICIHYLYVETNERFSFSRLLKQILTNHHLKYLEINPEQCEQWFTSIVEAAQYASRYIPFKSLHALTTYLLEKEDHATAQRLFNIIFKYLNWSRLSPYDQQPFAEITVRLIATNALSEESILENREIVSAMLAKLSQEDAQNPYLKAAQGILETIPSFTPSNEASISNDTLKKTLFDAVDTLTQESSFHRRSRRGMVGNIKKAMPPEVLDALSTQEFNQLFSTIIKLLEDTAYAEVHRRDSQFFQVHAWVYEELLEIITLLKNTNHFESRHAETFIQHLIYTLHKSDAFRIRSEAAKKIGEDLALLEMCTPTLQQDTLAHLQKATHDRNLDVKKNSVASWQRIITHFPTAFIEADHIKQLYETQWDQITNREIQLKLAVAYFMLPDTLAPSLHPYRKHLKRLFSYLDEIDPQRITALFDALQHPNADVRKRLLKDLLMPFQEEDTRAHRSSLHVLTLTTGGDAETDFTMLMDEIMSIIVPERKTMPAALPSDNRIIYLDGLPKTSLPFLKTNPLPPKEDALYGRTYVHRNPDAKIATHIKILKHGENPALLAHEFNNMNYIHTHQDKLNLKGKYPRGKTRLAKIHYSELPEYLHSGSIETQKGRLDLHKDAEGYYTVMIYESDLDEQGRIPYMTYLNDPDLTHEEFWNAYRTIIHDLFVLAKHGIFLPELIELFHSDPEHQRMYDWMVDTLHHQWSGRQGAGRVDNVTGATLYPNMRLTGLADLVLYSENDLLYDPEMRKRADSRIERLWELADGNEDIARNYLRASYLGDALLSLALMPLTYLQRRGELDYQHESQSTETFLQKALAELFKMAQTTYTGNAYPSLQTIDIQRMARQMAYFMTGQYVDDYKNDALNDALMSLYPGTILAFNTATMFTITPDGAKHVGNWVKGHGWDFAQKVYTIPSRNPQMRAAELSSDLGPFNGPTPIQELIHALYAITPLMILPSETRNAVLDDFRHTDGDTVHSHDFNSTKTLQAA